QASAKSIVPFISAWSSDPSLSQAFIPWFFNCVPNDEQQAQSVINEIFNKRGLRKVLVITDENYDSKQALKSFLKYLHIDKKGSPVVINFDKYSKTPDELASEINSSDPDCIVLLTKPETSVQIIGLLTKYRFEKPVYGSLQIFNENKLSEKELYNLEKVVIIPNAGWTESKFSAFKKNYKNCYGKNPGFVAAFAFDAMNTLIEAIRDAKSTDNEMIKKALSQIQYDGVTGTIRFGELGTRIDSCIF
ncbi:MAG TPA: ABC transporter substrate-binding protein, partial [Bacteroidales bacterium]|nr:ABC transporter substrate-binding protein [Bacteroidales bacterium]